MCRQHGVRGGGGADGRGADGAVAGAVPPRRAAGRANTRRRRPARTAQVQLATQLNVRFHTTPCDSHCRCDACGYVTLWDPPNCHTSVRSTMYILCCMYYTHLLILVETQKLAPENYC